jgi:hypothetical protein
MKPSDNVLVAQLRYAPAIIAKLSQYFIGVLAPFRCGSDQAVLAARQRHGLGDQVDISQGSRCHGCGHAQMSDLWVVKDFVNLVHRTTRDAHIIEKLNPVFAVLACERLPDFLIQFFPIVRAVVNGCIVGAVIKVWPLDQLAECLEMLG